MTVKFSYYQSRERVAGMLEESVRRLTANPNWATLMGDPSRDDVRVILDELDAIDTFVQARNNETQRLNELEAKLRAELVVPAAELAAVCRISNRSGTGRTHAGKMLVVGRGTYCLTHLRPPADQVVYAAVGKSEEERRAKGLLTTDEQIMLARQQELETRREPRVRQQWEPAG